MKEKLIQDIYTCNKIILNRALYSKHTRDDTQKYIPYLYADKPWLLEMKITLLKEIRNNLQNYAYYLIEEQFK